MCMNRNNVNVFPYSTFNWVGIDGTQVLCHMTPVGTIRSPFSLSLADSALHTSDTYNAQATANDITKALSNHKVLYLSTFQHRQLTSITILIEPRVELDVAPRFWQRRWWGWSSLKDARKCKTRIFFYLDFRFNDDDVGVDSSDGSEVLRTHRGSCRLYTWAAQLTSFMITSRQLRMQGAGCRIGGDAFCLSPVCGLG